MAPQKPITDVDTRNRILAVCGNAITRRNGVWYTHHSFGRIVELLAPRFAKIRYYAPQSVEAVGSACDYPLAHPNVTVHPWSVRRNSAHAMKRPDRLLRDYWRMVRTCDALFLRGSGPLLWTAHWMARIRGLPVVHWVVGNPLMVMGGERRGYGLLTHELGVQFARFEQVMTRIAVRLTKTRVLANGAELARIFQSDRTVQVISTSTSEKDFFVREDTCQEDAVRRLLVGFICPEKGLEYLVRALPLLTTSRRVHLAIVGSWEQFSSERERLGALIEELGLQDRVSWEGYAPFGRELFDQMDRSDMLVLPSLSEGTPRVLVEARARSLPVIASHVGGIPSSVTDGQDGLLVPPRDPPALSEAISRMIRDRNLRRRLICTGRENVRTWTIGRFVDLVVESLTSQGVSLESGVTPASDSTAV